MHIVFDEDGMQAAEHCRDSFRLQALIHHLDQSLPDLTISFCKLKDLPDTLAGEDVVCITTHYPEELEDSEIQLMKQSVSQGAALLLMSNHGNLPGRNSHDTRQYDARLASEFDIAIECSWFTTPRQHVLTKLKGELLAAHHPIISGGDTGFRITNVVTNNCSSLVADDTSYIVKLGPPLVDRRDNLPCEGRAFAVALDSNADMGRVVVVSDSGFIGSPGSKHPGPGLLDEGDNANFMTNVLLWLARKI